MKKVFVQVCCALGASILTVSPLFQLSASAVFDNQNGDHSNYTGVYKSFHSYQFPDGYDWKVMPGYSVERELSGGNTVELATLYCWYNREYWTDDMAKATLDYELAPYFYDCKVIQGSNMELSETKYYETIKNGTHTVGSGTMDGVLSYNAVEYYGRAYWG